MFRRRRDRQVDRRIGVRGEELLFQGLHRGPCCRAREGSAGFGRAAIGFVLKGCGSSGGVWESISGQREEAERVFQPKMGAGKGRDPGEP